MNADQNIKALVQEWAQAEESENTARLEEMLADNFFGIGPKGFVLFKEQWLQRFTGGLKYESVTVDDVQVKEYGKTAVLVAHQSQKATFNGNRSDGDFRMSQTWVEQGDSWKLASVQYGALNPNMPGKRP